MKNSKRIITLILALVMALSTMSFSALASNFSDITNEKVAEAVAKLVANGIITGYEDGTFRPDNQITRAEFAAVVTRMKGVANTVAPDAKTGFADLDNDESRAWARPYVKAAVDLGVINGFEDGTFRAAEPVTYEQAVKMLVCAMGYEVVAQSEYNKAVAANPSTTTWSTGYIVAANKHGFTKGAVTGKISEPASRGTVALLTSNAIDVPPLQVNQDGSVGKGDATESEEKQVQDFKGVVTGTYYTGIDSPVAGISLSQIKITTTENGEEIYDLAPSVAESIDFEDLIGKGVTAYYNTLDRQITAITKTNNKTTVIDEASVIRPIADGEIKYYNEKKKTTSVDLDDYTVIYNGKYIPSNSDIIDDLDDEFTNGTIELNETTGKKVAKITSYDVYVVDSFNRTTGKITFKYGAGFYTFPSSTVDKPEIYVDGKIKAYDSLSLRAYNVINLMEAPEVGGNVLNKMYVTTKYYSGKVTAELDKERTVELGGKEVILTNAYNEFDGSGKAPFSLGDSYKYYLDHTGQIAAIDYNAQTSSPYELGYIIDADRDNVNLIKKDKSFAIVPMKDKVKIDGVSTNNEDVKAKLEEIADDLYGEDTCAQPVKYIITNGELSAIDTAATAEGERATAIGSDSDDTFIYNDGGNATTSKTSVTVSGKLYQASSSTVVIYVPEDRTADYNYSIMAPAKAFASGGTREVKVFGADPEQRTKQPTMILIYGVDPAYDFVSSTPYMIVSSVNRASREIVGYENGSTETSVAISEDKFKSFEDDDALVTFEEVDKGDVIRYVEDATGVIAIEMIYDASDEGLLYQEGPSDNYMYYKQITTNVGELAIRYAEAFDIIESSQLSVTTAMGDSYTDADKQASGKLFTYKLSSATKVLTIDEEGELVILDTEEKYTSISTVEGGSSEVIIFTNDTTNNPAKTIYIVK